MKKFYFIILVVFFSCSTKTTKKETVQGDKKVEQKSSKTISLGLNCNEQSGNIGSFFHIKFNKGTDILPDSILVFENNIFNQKINPNSKFFDWNSENAKTGSNNLTVKMFWGDSLVASGAINFKLLSDIEPEIYTYKIIKTFNHSYQNYTQGLEFSNGYLYEGTGQYGESMLFKTDIDKNEVIHSLNLPKEVFGEGITIINNKVYQLTWQSQVGFVYNQDSFEKLYEFNYNTEGWGLTNNGKELIMSDGSENIYFLDTEFMQQVRKLEVYDNKGAINSLNELEYVNGLIYANIYGTDNIVAIDAQTGKVLKHINLKGILDKKSLTNPIDVLNGIAWDKTKQRLIVTGKWWPKMFEIELVKK